jgi:hypothetical protein
MLWKLLSALGLALGCTQFEPGSDELPEPSGLEETRADALTAQTGRDWSCIGPLGTSSEVIRNTANAARLVQSLQLLSLASGTVPKEVVVRACAQRDVNCTNPLTPDIPIDAEGWVDLPLYDGFDGFLEIRGPEIVSTLFFYQEPLSTTSRLDVAPLGVVEKTLLPMLTAAIGTQQDPALGLVYLRAFDCKNDEALDVRYTIDKRGVPFYFVAGLPSAARTETDSSGLGGFLNIPEGIAVVDASLKSADKDIALPKTILVRPNWMTGLRLIPSLRAAPAN